MGDSVEMDSGSLFNFIMGDMKSMMPMWEDFLVKASKFYSAVKSTALAADAFLDSFQRLADAATGSKATRNEDNGSPGATRDIGVSLTKLVMRHRSIDNKLKTYIGILTDSFIGPLQEKLEEWKKTASQLEKDHSKDHKKAKGEAKKATSEALKLKKKVVKKDNSTAGRPEYQDQYREALRIAHSNCAMLEDQEKQYLRKLMIEERSRAVFFLNCYRPVVEQELSLIGEIESLQSLVEDTAKQCGNPSQLPGTAEDAIENYKAHEFAALGTERTSPAPQSPTLESARDRAFTSIKKNQSPSKQLTRSNTIGATSGYGTLRKTGPPPKPVEIPTPSQNRTSYENVDTSFDGLSLHSSGDVSAYSSMSSLSTTSGGPHGMDSSNMGSQGLQPYGNDINDDASYYNGNPDAARPTHGVNQQLHPAFKAAARSSWSSIETSDSSGIGSYCSLNSQNRQPGQLDHRAKIYHSDGQLETTEVNDQLNFEVNEEMYMQMSGFHIDQGSAPSSPQREMPPTNVMPFQRNHSRTSSLRGTSCTAGGRMFMRSNSLTEGDELPDYRMNLPKVRGNATVSARQPPTGAKQTVFQIYGQQQTPAHLRSKLSPPSTPVKKPVPPPLSRKVSSPPVMCTTGRTPHVPLKSSSPPNLYGYSSDLPPPPSFDELNSINDYAVPYVNSGGYNEYTVPHQPHPVQQGPPVPPKQYRQQQNQSTPVYQQQYQQHNHVLPNQRQVQQHHQQGDQAAQHNNYLEQLRQHQQKFASLHQQDTMYDSHLPDDSLPEADPGSFLAELQQKRQVVKRRASSTDSYLSNCR